MESTVRKDLWLTSFGDLVTLLVCLFVMLTAMQHGRGLAQGGGEHAIELGVGEFSEDGTELKQNGVNTLKQLRISSSSTLAIQGCDGLFDVTQLSRTLAVARQISVIPTRGSIALGGSDCASGSVVRVTVGRRS